MLQRNERDCRKFDVVMAWVLGRSLIDLLRTIQDLEAVGVDLYLHQQHLDTTTPTGKLLFHVTGAFSEFERSMIRQRVNAGLSAIKARIKRDGHLGTVHKLKREMAVQSPS
jgi:DNA invertase Pin-like site-specific DNA recombinase